jgi:hypothetical protein
MLQRCRKDTVGRQRRAQKNPSPNGEGFLKNRRYLLSHFWYYHRLEKLNGRVRYGNACGLSDMVTGSDVAGDETRHTRLL